MATNNPNAQPKLLVRTQVQVTLQIRNGDTYDSKMTIAEIQRDAAESAIGKIRCLNDPRFELVGAPVVKVVICEDPQ